MMLLATVDIDMGEAVGRYKHLSIEEREDIMAMRREGRSMGEVARALGRSKSTVSRELGRNSCRAGQGSYYRASTAQRRYAERRARCVRRKRLSDPWLRELVQRKILEDRWSPEQVSGRVALEAPGSRVSASTIYRAIGARELDTPELRRTARGLRGRLRHKGKRRHRAGGPEERRGKVPGMRPISERPAEAGSRERLGDWEADTVVGRGGGACLVTLVDRSSGFLAGGRAGAHTAACVRDVQVAALAGQPALTVTPDRGKEFAAFREVEAATGAEFFFALPHSPWQRGTNENTNGLLREYFPKGTDFGPVGDDEVQGVYDAVNRRPRKRLGYRAPYEVHYSTVLHLL